MGGRILRALGVGTLGLALGCSAANDAGNGGAGNGTGNGGSGNFGAVGNGGGGGINVGGDSGSGNSGGFSGSECAGVTQTANNAVVPADVIWTIDTSCSMTEETAAVRANMNKFSQLISNAGVDIHIVLIAEEFKPSPFPGIIPDEGICIDAPLGSGQCPNDTKQPTFLHLFQTVNSTDSLQLILSTFPQWKGALRPNSMKIFTVVTDDNSALPAQGFIDGLNALDPTLIKPSLWKLYGVFCFTDCPSAAKPGDVYGQLVNLTGGVGSDLCLQNFDPVFNQLAQGVIASSVLDCGWTIPPVPQGETFDKNKVNVVFTSGDGSESKIPKVNSPADCATTGGWYYDDDANPTSVLLCPDTCSAIQADPNGKIDIQFGCQTITAVPQ
jgi:hypothetical protein